MPKKVADEPAKTPAATEKKADLVEVKLAAEHPSGNHTVFLANTRVDFVDGTAKVLSEVADELRKLGIVQ